MENSYSNLICNKIKSYRENKWLVPDSSVPEATENDFSVKTSAARDLLSCQRFKNNLVGFTCESPV